MAYVFQQRFENKIEEKLPSFEQSNDEKRIKFIVCDETVKPRVFMTLIFGSNISKRKSIEYSNVFEKMCHQNVQSKNQNLFEILSKFCRNPQGNGVEFCISPFRKKLMYITRALAMRLRRNLKIEFEMELEEII